MDIYNFTFLVNDQKIYLFIYLFQEYRIDKEETSMGACMIVSAKDHSPQSLRQKVYISSEESARIEEEVRGEPEKPNQDIQFKQEQPIAGCKTQENTIDRLRNGTPTSIKSRFFRQKNDQQSEASSLDTAETVNQQPSQLQFRPTRKNSSKRHKKHHSKDDEWDQGKKFRKAKRANIIQCLQKKLNGGNTQDSIIVRTKKPLVLSSEVVKCIDGDGSLESQNEEKYQNIQTDEINSKTIIYRDGSAYTGEMKDGKRNGKGVMRWKDGSIYDGQWQDNSLNGYGKLVYADKDQYIGQFKDNKAEGIGQFKDNKAEGKGKFQSVIQGATYEGEWKDGLPHGQGTQNFRNGQKYSGEWSSGKKNGYGQLIFEDGVSFYRGNFIKNELHGHGEYFWSGKNRYEGEWQHNQKSGNGIMWWQSGQRFEGQFLHDKMHGHGTFLQTDGGSFNGNWECGRRDGVFIETTSSGEVRHSVWYFNKFLNYVDAGMGYEHREEHLPRNLYCKA